MLHLGKGSKVHEILGPLVDLSGFLWIPIMLVQNNKPCSFVEHIFLGVMTLMYVSLLLYYFSSQ
jgi:hypothetical protein